jgi:hypothetical protein
VSIAGLTGCSQITGGNDIKDTDGDGVIDSEDYAPRDASVQDAEDVEETDSTETDEQEEEEDKPAEQDNTQTGNTFSIEAATQGEVRLSESVPIENLGTSQPDIVIGTPFNERGDCWENNYNATVSDVNMNVGGNSYNIVDTASVESFKRSKKSKDVYSNPADGSESWEFSFNLDLGDVTWYTPDHYHCNAWVTIFLTEDGDWFNEPDVQPPEDTIRYYIRRNQGRISIYHGVAFFDNNIDYDGELVKKAEKIDNVGDYDWYEENTEWDITITRK